MTNRGLDRPATAAKVIAWLVEGKKAPEIAELVSTKRRTYSRQAVYAFARRHKADIEALQTKVVEVVEDVTIRDKGERIRRLAALVDGMQEIIATRGLMASEPRWITSYLGVPDKPEEGEARKDATGAYLITAGQVLAEVVRFDAALVREYRAALHDVAQELGEIPKASITIDNRQQTLITLEAIDRIIEAMP